VLEVLIRELLCCVRGVAGLFGAGALHVRTIDIRARVLRDLSCL